MTVRKRSVKKARKKQARPGTRSGPRSGAAALRKSEENLKKAEKIAMIGNWEWNILTNELLWSDEVFRIYGADPLQVKPSYDIVVKTLAPECRERFLKSVDDAIKAGAHFEGEYRMVGLDGEERFTHTIGEVVRDRTGRPVSMFGVVQDITRRKKVEESLRKAETLYQELVETAQDLIWQCDAEGRYTYLNTAWEEVLGYGVEEMLGRKFRDFQDPGIARRDAELFKELLQGGMVKGYKTVHRAKNGKSVHLVFNAKYVRDDEGRVTGTRGTAYDVTERDQGEQSLRESEERLKESERRLRTLIDALPDAVVFKDATGRHVIANKANEALFGLSPEMFLGKTVEDLLPADLAAVCRKNDEDVLKNKKTVRDEELATDRNGNRQVLDTIRVPIYDDDDNAMGLVGIIRDITERKLDEEKIRQSEEFVRNILDTVDEGFIVVDRDYRIVTANKAYCGQAGKPCDGVIGRHCFEISHKASRPCYEEGEECAVRQVFATGKPHAALHRHLDAHGQALFVETKAFPLVDNNGNVTSAIETISNITEKHLLEEERLKTQKLESIGTLAGGIAHDFNNLLQGVFGYISLAKVSLGQPEKASSMLDQAEKALQQSVNLTTQLLTFSRGGKPVRKTVALRPVIENAVKFALSGSRINYRIDVDDRLCPVNADEGQIGQVIQNIVLNADQAMPMGGAVEISARNVRAYDPGTPQGLASGEFVAIAVKDIGIGIPEHFLSRIFDPYFTTKEKGSGLGLATSYSIVKNHDGLIDVQSETGRGSVFTIYLPAASAEMPAARTASAATYAGRAGRILVMDDEEIVRLVAGELIRSLGHAVEFSEHGAAAVEKYRQAFDSGMPYDIVILDLTIRGGMGGVETLAKLRAIDSEVKAVVSSGYSDGSVTADFAAHGFRGFLKKPYDLNDLNKTLAELLPE